MTQIVFEFPENKNLLNISGKAKNTPLVIGGIYMYKEDKINDEYYDGKYALCMGTDRFMFLIDGMYAIDMEVELACAHRMKLAKGYCLAINKREKKWYVRNSGIKGQPGYILAEGEYLEGFEESLRPFMKVFMK